MKEFLTGSTAIEPSTGPKRPILSVRGVSKQFTIGAGSAATRIDALHGIDVEVQKGEFVCLLGASGCGKSTLLRIVAGFEQPSEGAVTMYGAPIVAPGPERGMVFQDYGLFPWLTVRENIAFGPRERGIARSHVDAIADRFTGMVGLQKFASYYPAQLSGGMKQRVAIARVLANDCELLLMDEPFGALDALTRERLQAELLDIWQQTRLTVLFVTHSVEEAVFLANRVLVMSAGPGRISDDIRIDLPRPRDVSSPEFNDVRRALTGRLTSHLAPGVAPG
jgi:ABC-type nitrate/sulfonate/bicarbonate transport system ATPase subunit